MSKANEVPTVWGGLSEGIAEGEKLLQTLQKLYNLIRALVLLVTSAVAFPVEMLIHYRIGERYLTFVSYLLGAFVVSLTQLLHEPMSHLFSGMYTIAIVVHWWMIKRRNKRGIRWHSRSMGLSWPIFDRLKQNHWRVYQIVEPGMIGIVGLIMLKTGNDFGWYLIAAAACIVVKTAMFYAAERAKILDAIDQQIESEHMATAIGGDRHPRETEGFIVPGSAQWTPEERAIAKSSISAAYANLDPALKSLVEPKVTATTLTDGGLVAPPMTVTNATAGSDAPATPQGPTSTAPSPEPPTQEPKPGENSGGSSVSERPGGEPSSKS